MEKNTDVPVSKQDLMSYFRQKGYLRVYEKLPEGCVAYRSPPGVGGIIFVIDTNGLVGCSHDVRYLSTPLEEALASLVDRHHRWQASSHPDAYMLKKQHQARQRVETRGSVKYLR